MTLFILDVSQWQGGAIDFAAIKSAGISGVVVRCVMENGGIDPDYVADVSRARAAGLMVGAYAFLSGGGVAASQAASFIKAVGDPADQFIMLDVERPSAHPVPTAADVRTFAKAWYAKWPSHRLFIYGSKGGPLGSLGDLSDCGSLWLADYPTSTAGTPAAIYAADGGDASPMWGVRLWDTPAFVQFSSSASVPGISGRVDVSAFRGSLDELRVAANTGVASNVNSFTVPSVPSIGDVAKGVTIYLTDALAAGAGNIIIDPARSMPYVGDVSPTVRMVEYVNASGVHTGKVYFIHAADLTNIRPVPAPTPDCSAPVAAAVAPLKDQLAKDLDTIDAQAAVIAQQKTALAEATAKVTDLTAQNAAQAQQLADAQKATQTVGAFQTLVNFFLGLFGKA